MISCSGLAISLTLLLFYLLGQWSEGGAGNLSFRMSIACQIRMVIIPLSSSDASSIRYMSWCELVMATLRISILAVSFLAFTLSLFTRTLASCGDTLSWLWVCCMCSGYSNAFVLFYLINQLLFLPSPLSLHLSISHRFLIHTWQ